MPAKQNTTRALNVCLPIAAVVTIIVHMTTVTTETIAVMGAMKFNATIMPEDAVNADESNHTTTIDANAIDPKLGKLVDHYAKAHNFSMNSSAIGLGGWGPLVANPYFASNVTLSVVGAVEHASRDGAWLLGMGVALLGILWPVLQLVALLMVVMLVRLGWVHVDARRSIMGILVPLSKWSLFVVFFVASAAVMVDATSPESDVDVLVNKYEGKDLRVTMGTYVLHLNLKCLPGLALFCLALVSSTALVHWADHELAGHTSAGSPTEHTGLLAQEGVDSQHSASNSEAAFTDNTLLLAVATMSLLVTGASRTLVSIERHGAFGKALQASADHDVSVFGLMKALLSQPHLRLQPMMIMMAGVLLMLIFVVPLLELVVIVQSAGRRMQGYNRQCALAFRLYGLDCLEVFLVSTALLSADLGDIIYEEAERRCDHKLLSDEERLTKAGLLHLKDDDCFVQTLHLGIGWWLLFAAVIFRGAVWQSSAGQRPLIVEAALTLGRKAAACWSRVASWSSSQGKQPVTPRLDSWRMKWLLPALVAVNMVLLVAGHVCLYLHVVSHIEFSLRYIPDHTLAPLNFLGTISRSFKAQAYLMAVTVAMWVVVWPYVKLLATLAIASWVRNEIITPDKAVQVLEGMNGAAKLSFVEVFFFCIAAVTSSMDTPKHHIRMRVASTEHFDVRVQTGTFTFSSDIELLPGAMVMIAAIVLVTILTHWVEYELEAVLPSKASPVVAHSEKRNLRALVASVGALLFLLLGLEQKMMTIDRQGFLGNALGPSSKFDMSVRSLISSLRKDDPSLAAQPTVQVLALVTAFLALVAPTLEMMFLIASLHWAKAEPCLSSQMRRAAEWLYSFDCVEVLLGCCLVILFDFSNFMAYMVKDECTRMQGFLTEEKLDKIGLLHLYDEDCLRVKSSLGLGFWFFCIVVVLRSIAWRQAPRHEPASSSSERASGAIAIA